MKLNNLISGGSNIKHSTFKIIIVITGFLILNVKTLAQEKSFEISKDNPMSQQGTVSFILHTNTLYANGYAVQESFSYKLLEIPGLATVTLDRDYSAIFISMQWDSIGIHTGFYLLFSELPGPESYHLLFTWDAEKGLSDGYFNGFPFRLENPIYYDPWEVVGSGTQFNVPPGSNDVTNVVILNKYFIFVSSIVL